MNDRLSAPPGRACERCMQWWRPIEKTRRLICYDCQKREVSGQKKNNPSWKIYAGKR
jgi:hypothetical protein